MNYISIIKNNPLDIWKIPPDKMSGALRRMAVSMNGNAIKYIPSILLDEGTCLAAIRQNPEALLCLGHSERTPLVVLMAVSEMPRLYEYLSPAEIDGNIREVYNKHTSEIKEIKIKMHSVCEAYGYCIGIGNEIYGTGQSIYGAQCNAHWGWIGHSIKFDECPSEISGEDISEKGRLVPWLKKMSHYECDIAKEKLRDRKEVYIWHSVDNPEWVNLQKIQKWGKL